MEAPPWKTIRRWQTPDVDRHQCALAGGIFRAQEVPCETIDVCETLIGLDLNDVTLNRDVSAEVV